MNFVLYDIWYLIFTNLNVPDRLNCRFICKNWKNIIDDHNTWSDIKIIIENIRDINLESIKWIYEITHFTARMKRLKLLYIIRSSISANNLSLFSWIINTLLIDRPQLFNDVNYVKLVWKSVLGRSDKMDILKYFISLLGDKYWKYIYKTRYQIFRIACSNGIESIKWAAKKFGKITFNGELFINAFKNSKVSALFILHNYSFESDLTFEYFASKIGYLSYNDVMYLMSIFKTKRRDIISYLYYADPNISTKLIDDYAIDGFEMSLYGNSAEMVALRIFYSDNPHKLKWLVNVFSDDFHLLRKYIIDHRGSLPDFDLSFVKLFIKSKILTKHEIIECLHQNCFKYANKSSLKYIITWIGVGSHYINANHADSLIKKAISSGRNDLARWISGRFRWRLIKMIKFL